MNPQNDHLHLLSRRHFFKSTGLAAGRIALGGLLFPEILRAATKGAVRAHPALPELPHFAPKAKRLIYLFMNGGPSQMDLLDYKPGLEKIYDTDLPDSIRQGQRLTTMTSGQTRFPIAPSKYSFKQYGQSGIWFSELLQHTAKIADDIAVIKSVHTEAINHDPAVTYIQTGNQIPGKPSLGSWLSYGLGSECDNLPAFVVMTPSWSAKRDAQALYQRLWEAGFLPTKHSGVSLRAKGDPVLYLNDPPGVDRETRRHMLDALGKLNTTSFQRIGDPEINTRIAQYEMAFRMQSSVPELTNISSESKATLELYGPEVTTPGTFAHSALMARRLAERGVRCIELFHREWDHHGDLPRDLPLQCRDVDQACYGLITDLKSRGLRVAGADGSAVGRDDVDFAIAVDHAHFEQRDRLVLDVDADLAEATVVATDLDDVVAVDGESGCLAAEENPTLIELLAFALCAEPAFGVLAEHFDIGATFEVWL